MHIAGGAAVAGLGGGSIGSAAQGAAGAGISAAAAGKLNELSGDIAASSPTGNADADRALGNIIANVIATGAGAAVGGDTGAATASSVDLYNRSAHDDVGGGKKPKDLVSQVCGAGAQCSDATLNAAIQAQGANAEVAAANLQTMGAYGAPAAALALIGPEAVTAAILAGGLDYGGSAYSYYTGLSKDQPNLTNSYIAGVVGGLSYPLAIGGSAISAMGTGGKIAANTYNAAVAGVGAFGTAGMTGSNPGLSGGIASVTTAAGSWASAVLPAPFGNLVNQIMQGAAGPIQNVIQSGK